ncbi:hypothetical protein MSAS_08630 [Mycobacterium saskatchewanense]|uniref:Uncharacterized protein n=1 Tax=Mycobacterium saskatchewanense TaxID=220927 RepID=A0AAJ3NM38_9MYCO|nr:hypothetical protein [Mycobacterium saskatchewanense]ORW69039.1 hypothetical protein AWC23_19990 [Mycobacterium saskatchewanense]BBX61689.1 hypothetical protein MSAS_08630 [Mycobacterium saskatchewanense]
MADSGRHRAAQSRSRDGANPPNRRGELIAAAGGATVLAVVGLFSGWANHSLTSARPVAATTAPAAPADTMVPAAPSPMRVPLRTWLSQAEPSIDALLTARQSIASAAANNDIARTGATCESAKDAVGALQHALPSPDARLNNAFQQAINRYGVGLQYCTAGAQNRDARDMAQAATYIRQANGELQAAVDLATAQVPREPEVLTV